MTTFYVKVTQTKKSKAKPGEERIAARSIDSPSFNIRLAENPLDVYRSPHLLDLSRLDPMADSMRFRQEAPASYLDLPGGRFLAQYHLLDFWDFRQSEIVTSCRKFFERLASSVRAFSNDPELSPKLLIDKELEATPPAIFEEVSLVNLLLFVAEGYYKIYLFFYKIFWLAYVTIRKLVTRDQTIWLPPKTPAVDPAKAAIVERIIAASQERTISQIVKPKLAVAADKFKIVDYSPSSHKAVREKYLSGNFTRKGVVANPQPPVASWPKDSFTWDIRNFVFSFSGLKTALAAAVIILLATSSAWLLSDWHRITGIRGLVLGEAEQAMTNIGSAQDSLRSLDFAAAKEKFLAANTDFISAKNQLGDIKSFMRTLAEISPAENTFKSGTNLIDLGDHLSAAAASLLGGIEVASNSTLSLSSRVKNFSLAVEPATSELKSAIDNAANVGVSHLPADYQQKYLDLKDSLPATLIGLTKLRDTADFAVSVLGDNDLRRYLLVFQNDNELRATGGFMGSFALLDLRGGKIEKITVPAGGTYDVRAGFHEIVTPPQPLTLVADRWEFQDSNWWPDFPASASNIKWFYEKSGGPTVDGVMVINSSFLGQLLKVTGPIALADYGKTIDVANYEVELQKSIELEATDKTKPKKILTELAPLLLDKIMNASPAEFFNLAEILGQGLKARDIQMYFSDSELEKFAKSNGWAGECIADAGADYLNVVSSNIGGGKTDNVIKQKIYLQTEIQADGSVVNKLLIERYNFGSTDDVFTKVANNSYLRVYVPLGSELIQAVGFKGFTADKFKVVDDRAEMKPELAAENGATTDEKSGTKIYTENSQTVFANWTIAGPGESHELLLVYKLPFKVAVPEQSNNIISLVADALSPPVAAYSLKFQKQAGRSADEFVNQVTYPADLSLKFAYPNNAELSGGQVIFKAMTDSDKYFVTGFVKK